MSGAADTLFLPFSNGDLSANSGEWLYLGARAPDKGFPDGLVDQLVCEQHMRGPFLDLQIRGANVSTAVMNAEPFAGAFILIGKHRGENEAMIGRAASLCRQDAKVVIAGDKTIGIASLKRRIAQTVPIEGSLAKYHATAFWIDNEPKLKDLAALNAISMPTGFQTAPGMFSPESIDKGSAILANFIDKSIRGSVADFGAGWGYLSQIIAQNSAASSLDLFEAHWPSLEAAKANLRSIDRLPLVYHWLDITRETITRRFDWIVMNPPFHTGRKTEPGLGEKFIETSEKALKPNGRLLLVANSGLPYEKKILAHFSNCRELEKRDGFKILLAEK
ncbi:MAG: class I SAM-dependent methyltransferase [Pseudomonadota bacterium]